MHEDRNAGGEPIATEDEDILRYTSTRPLDGVIPSGYGTSGGFIPPRKDDAERDREESATDDHG